MIGRALLMVLLIGGVTASVLSYAEGGGGLLSGALLGTFVLIADLRWRP